MTNALYVSHPLQMLTDERMKRPRDSRRMPGREVLHLRKRRDRFHPQTRCGQVVLDFYKPVKEDEIHLLTTGKLIGHQPIGTYMLDFHSASGHHDYAALRPWLKMK